MKLNRMLFGINLIAFAITLTCVFALLNGCATVNNDLQCERMTPDGQCASYIPSDAKLGANHR